MSGRRKRGETRERALALRAVGLRQGEIAAQLGVTPQAVSLALKPRPGSHPIDRLTPWLGDRQIDVRAAIVAIEGGRLDAALSILRSTDALLGLRR